MLWPLWKLWSKHIKLSFEFPSESNGKTETETGTQKISLMCFEHQVLTPPVTKILDPPLIWLQHRTLQSCINCLLFSVPLKIICCSNFISKTMKMIEIGFISLNCCANKRRAFIFAQGTPLRSKRGNCDWMSFYHTSHGFYRIFLVLIERKNTQVYDWDPPKENKWYNWKL